MQTPRECFIETIKPDGKPDRLLKQYEPFAFISNNPLSDYVRGKRYRGMPPTKDAFGTTMIWPADDVAAMPHITEELKVVQDITSWREFTKIPDIIANCSEKAMWEPFVRQVQEVNRAEYLVMPYLPTGVFERLHFLMGFEDTFINLLTEPEAMADLCEAIGEYRYNCMKVLNEMLKPDAVLSHDDWGSKTNLFIRPELWREFIKPQYVKQYGYLHEQGVKIIHHSDSFCEQIVPDMIDLKIDVWQGAIPQNDIAKLLQQTEGKITIMGGLDAAIVDREDSTEEEIRAEVRRACGDYGAQGHFIPSITYGGPGTIFPENGKIIDDEIDRINAENS